MNKMNPLFSTPFRSLVLTGALVWVACAPSPEPSVNPDQTGSTGGNPSASFPSHYSKIDFPGFEYHPPEPSAHKVELVDGAVAYFVQDSALNLLRLTLLTRAGTPPVKPEAVAARNLYSALLKSGGTQRLPSAKLEDSLEFMAASLSAGLGDYQNRAAFDGLARDQDALLGLLPEVILKPGLEADVFELEKRETLEGWQHRYDTPRGIMGRLSEYVAYGSHPVNWIPTEAEIKAVRVSSLKPFSGLGFTRKNLVFGIAGKFDSASMKVRLDSLVKKFPQDTAATVLPEFRGFLPAGVYLVDKPFSQATLKLEAPGVQRPHPDYYPLVLASSIFGDGGFTSRLVERVRSNEGLAYGISSQVGSDYSRKGTVSVGLQTKAATGAYAIRLVLEEMKRMADSGVTDSELARAKDGLEKSLPSLFDTPAATARIFSQGEVWGRNPDHYRAYLKRIKSISKQEVEAAFKKYFVPDSLRISVVGPKEVLMAKDAVHGDSLAAFGKIQVVNLETLDAR
jgi:zinc protease